MVPAEIRLSRSAARAVASGHPWVFREGPERFPVGAVLRLIGPDGRAVGFGLADDGPVAVRVLGRGEPEPLDRLLADRLGRADRCRWNLLPPDTDAYRLVNGAGDGLPGLIVDRYGEYLAVQVTALAMAVRHRARFFAVAPCCQAELARAWAAEPGPLGLLQRNPHLRRTVAASTTDALRAELMGARGYEVKAVEFVEAHHTPKNTLIFGHRRLDPGDLEGYRALVAGTGGHGIALEALLDSLGAEVTADGP
jgi:hypothetical protein